MRSAAGNMQVAVTAVGFTTLFFIIVVLAGALFMGYGRRPDGSSRMGGPDRGGGRPEAREQWSRGQLRDTGGLTGAEQMARGAQPLRPQQPVRSGFQAGGKFGVSHVKDMLTVEVNPNKCARFGFCEHEAPDVFYLESDGRFGYQATVSVDKMDQVITAMDVCPRRAIKVKIPPGYDPLSMPPPPDLPEDRRAVIPIMGDRMPEDEAPRPPRRA